MMEADTHLVWDQFNTEGPKGPALCSLDARFRNPPIGGFKHVECLCGTPWIVSLEKTWFFQLCMIASTLFWSNSMDTFNGLIVLRVHF